ncbi:GNAT family N-acetyltransferase [Smaragdicoccus niigatensis]|uniref:GNAT family N-acetyltransferase n=1 Tax=Smaragdicoccus niigatensis TaxID=359359 RepID=UPI000382B4F6|nr:GNAT family N-acetyltransferase [Smaragdicoccus niigatensis]
MTVTVTPLHANSVAALAQCHIDCWRESYRGLVADHVLNAFDVARRADQWERVRAAGLSRIYTAVNGSGVVGFAAATDAELDALYVRQSHWGTGLSNELIEAAIGDDSTRLWVFEENHRAVRFYRRHGFVADNVSRIEPFTGLTEIRMSR